MNQGQRTKKQENVGRDEIEKLGKGVKGIIGNTEIRHVSLYVGEAGQCAVNKFRPPQSRMQQNRCISSHGTTAAKQTVKVKITQKFMKGVSRRQSGKVERD